MKTYYICIEAGHEGVKLKADWFEWINDLIFYDGHYGDEDNSEVIAVIKKWEYFFEIKE
jgi:hypothetical protein